jgi:hypothetical protein
MAGTARSGAFSASGGEEAAVSIWSAQARGEVVRLDSFSLPGAAAAESRAPTGGEGG